MPAGQLTDAALEFVAEPELSEQVNGGYSRLCSAASGEHGGERHVFFGGEFGHKQPLLEDEPEAASPQGGALFFGEGAQIYRIRACPGGVGW